MKVIIQIPCFNEEQALPITISALPRTLQGIDTVEWMIVDDGSTDRTVMVAKSLGVHHIVKLRRHLGLAGAFSRGIDEAIARGADIIVNTDADNQYCADDIEKLTAPILAGYADIVIGARPIDATEHFSITKKLLQRFGSWVVRLASRTEVKDAPSGFRAFSREAAVSIRVFSRYSYTIETIIQAGQNQLRILSVPIRTNPDLRPSRLAKSTFRYVLRSSLTIFRVFALYYPFEVFSTIGASSLAAGMLLGLRFIVLFATHHGTGHVQSLILCAVLILVSFTFFALAVLADIVGVNRKMLERVEGMLTNRDAARRDQFQFESAALPLHTFNPNENTAS